MSRSLYTEFKAEWMFPVSNRKIRFSTPLTPAQLRAAAEQANSVTHSIRDIRDDFGSSAFSTSTPSDSKANAKAVSPSLPPVTDTSLVISIFPIDLCSTTITNITKAIAPTAVNTEIQATTDGLVSIFTIDQKSAEDILRRPHRQFNMLQLKIERMPSRPPPQAPVDTKSLIMSLLNPQQQQ